MCIDELAGRKLILTEVAIGSVNGGTLLLLRSLFTFSLKGCIIRFNRSSDCIYFWEFKVRVLNLHFVYAVWGEL